MIEIRSSANHLDRKLAGFTRYPDQEWMEQQARNMTMEEWGYLRGCRYLLHDRDTKFCQSFRSETGRIHAVPGSGVDGAAGAKHDDGRVGIPERLPLSAA